MITMFRTTRHDTKITAHEVTKCTASQVTFMDTFLGKPRESRENKSTEWHQWHETWSEAHDHLTERAQSRIAWLNAELKKVSGELHNIKGMKHPMLEQP